MTVPVVVMRLGDGDKRLMVLAVVTVNNKGGNLMVMVVLAVMVKTGYFVIQVNAVM